MKQLVVKENGKDVYIQTLEKSKEICEGKERYCEYSIYFKELIEIAAEYLQDVDYILEVTDEYTLMTLRTTVDYLEEAKNLKEALLNKFPNDIEDIGIVNQANTRDVILNIRDFFYEFN